MYDEDGKEAYRLPNEAGATNDVLKMNSSGKMVWGTNLPGTGAASSARPGSELRTELDAKATSAALTAKLKDPATQFVKDATKM